MTNHAELLKAAQADREARPWNYYRFDHDTMKRLLNEMADKLVLALDAAEQRGDARGAQWQLIETAPKDGTPVLVFDAGAMSLAQWDDQAKHWMDDCGYVMDPWPTHWMPLPPSPPEAESSDKENAR